MTNDEEVIAQKRRELEWLMWADQRDEYEAHLPKFISASWPIIEPVTRYLSNWHVDLICEYLEACYARDIKRLVINIPPRHMKSIAVTVCFPAWSWTKAPGLRFVFASYNQNLSIKHSVDRRSIIESTWYQQYWGSRFNGEKQPWVKLRGDQNVKSEFQNTQRGVMLATSIGGGVTGKGGDFIVIDDPHDPEKAMSDVERASDIAAFDSKFTTRLDNPAEGVIICVMQRVHEGDLAGHLLRDHGYTHLKIPAIQPKPQQYSFPRSGRQLIREAGEILWAERFSQPVLDSMRISMGGYGFSGQMQQEPSPPDGAMIKRHWFKYYQQLPADLDFVCSSWDCTFKDSDGTDYVVGQVWARKGANKYLVDQVRARMTYTETKAAMRTMFAKHPNVTTHFIEDKANGSAVIDELKNDYTMIAVEPHGGKVSRASGVSPQIEAGNVYLPMTQMSDGSWGLQPWVGEFIDECAAFPKGMFDDCVDAMTQALVQMSKRAGIMDFYKELAEKKANEEAEAKKKLAAGMMVVTKTNNLYYEE